MINITTRKERWENCYFGFFFSSHRFALFFLFPLSSFLQPSILKYEEVSYVRNFIQKLCIFHTTIPILWFPVRRSCADFTFTIFVYLVYDSIRCRRNWLFPRLLKSFSFIRFTLFPTYDRNRVQDVVMHLRFVQRHWHRNLNSKLNWLPIICFRKRKSKPHVEWMGFG